MILVAGGTGRLGTLVVDGLLTAGLDVRVLTRDPARARHLDGRAEIVQGDVRDRSSLDAAVRGVTAVVSAVQGFAGPGRVSPATVDRAGNANLVDAAVAASADVVLVSVVGAAADSAMELFRAKHAAEQQLRASGAGWTIVRSTAFVELWAEILAKRIVFGRGDNPINFVSVHDVAAVVLRAALDPRLRGRTIEVGGPQNLTFNELAVLVQEARREQGRMRHVPRPLLRLLAPATRVVRAALVMDTADLTFDAAAARAAFAELPMTGVRDALERDAARTSGHEAA